MTHAEMIGNIEVNRFRSVIARRLGLHFDDNRLGTIAEMLRRRAEASDLVHEAYLQHLETENAREEMKILAQECTVTETYFFRSLDQYHVFIEIMESQCLQTNPNTRLKILSAGCASGEEPYSLAILSREKLADRASNVSILAVDINTAMLEKAARGCYSAWALRETRPDIQKRWFQSKGREVVLDQSVRESVTFKERNLVQENPDLWVPHTYDVIFCRNVIMYFTPECAHAVVARMARALVPGGYLFLGHAETLRGISQDFHLCHTHGTFYYQKKNPDEKISGHFEPRVTSSIPVLTELADVIEGSGTWVETIRLATERIQALSEVSHQPAISTSPMRSQWDLGSAMGLLQKERFAEALEEMQSLPIESARDPEVLLLRAVLLTHRGQLKESELVCRNLLEIDELNAGAHYLLALCREGVGDYLGAIEHDQVAIYLDPAFAMPRLHLGLMARRNGNFASARKDLSRALSLLQREDGSKLLLFGGGFGRENLISLCGAELRRCGGTP